MRQITNHIVDGDSSNHQIAIEVKDEPGQGGACHRYEVTGFDTITNKSASVNGYQASFARLIVLFQNGPIKDFGVNGVTQEALLAIVIDRLKGFQSGQFACAANALALDHCERALWHLQGRTRERLARGVEGTNQQ